jgi:CheY-like chemotaxis protein
MPGMNGIEFIKVVRTLPNYKFMPILFLTTESQQSKRLEAKAAGASGWLVIPATADELLSTIKLVIPSRSWHPVPPPEMKRTSGKLKAPRPHPRPRAGLPVGSLRSTITSHFERVASR